MISIKQNNILVEEMDLDLNFERLSCRIETAEIAGVYLQNHYDLVNIVDAVKNIKVPKTYNGEYTIEYNKEEDYLYIMSNDNKELKLCYDKRKVLPYYVEDLRVILLNGRGRFSQLTNFERYTKSNAIKGAKVTTDLFALDTYHYIDDLILLEQSKGQYMYYSDTLSEEYLESVLSQYNTDKQNRLIDAEREGDILSANDIKMSSINIMLNLLTRHKTLLGENADDVLSTIKIKVGYYYDKTIEKFIQDITEEIFNFNEISSNLEKIESLIFKVKLENYIYSILIK